MIVHINSPGGTTAGSEELFDSLRALQAKKPMVVVVDGLAASGGYIAAMSRRPHRRAGHLAGRLDRRAVPVSERHRAAEDHRRQGRGDQVLAAQGRAERLRADQPGGARRDRGDRDRIPTPGSRAWWGTAASWTMRSLPPWPTAASSPAARASALKLIDELGDEQTAIAWLAKEKSVPADTPVRDYPLQAAVRRPVLPARRGVRLRGRGPFRRGAAPRGLGRGAGGRAAQP